MHDILVGSESQLRLCQSDSRSTLGFSGPLEADAVESNPASPEANRDEFT